ncbi:hypothetical protein F511_13298 [Dorcoceras hygrometricum]|uniref:Uncharacterized protein n=1 Tax=Dorcoceras hygrometricum TaxID=472368 RepID=A0A2Z7BUI1_9LAMI|nr:hypothetical protein F511_13298 [Dorcoceras hygrometricum]
MSEIEETFSKLLSLSSSCSWNNREADDEVGGGDEEFYEKLEAPKFVDFTVPDHFHPDDRYWFCLRVGCDQKHEEEMDHEEIYKNFVLRVMAARSPNIRLRKALGNSSRTPLKCPMSAPPKSSKPRLAIMSTISQKMDGEMKRIMKPPLKPGLTPMAKVKQVASKYLTTPRNKPNLSSPKSFRSVQIAKPCHIEVPKSRMVAKALVFHSPKKTIKVKTSTPLTKCKQMNKLEITDQRKHHALGYSSKSSSNWKTDASRKKGELIHSQTCVTVQAKSVGSNRSKSYSKLPNKQVSMISLDDPLDSSKLNEGSSVQKRLPAAEVVKEFENQQSVQEEGSKSLAAPPLLYNTDPTLGDDSNGERRCVQLEGSDSESFQATYIEHNDINNGNEQNETSRINSYSHVESFSPRIETDSCERERNECESMDCDDKENAAVVDENRRHDYNIDQNGRKTCMHDKRSNIKKERRILKEATLERRAILPLASENESSRPSGGKLQMKQGSDNQRGKSTTTTIKKQHNHCHSAHQEPKQMSSPLKSNATQRLERFRKIASPVQGRLASTKKEAVTSFLIPGQKLEVIHEILPKHSELRSARKETRNDVSFPTVDTSFRSTPRIRRHVTAVEPNFHGTDTPRSCCTKKLLT